MSRYFRWFGITVLVAVIALLSPVVFGQEEKPEETQEEKPAAPPTEAPPTQAPPTQAPPATSAPPAIPASAPVKKATIELADKAKGNGEIVFGFTPTGGAAMQIRVTVAAKMNASEVAQDIAKEFAVVIGDKYQAKADGPKVKIEGKEKATFNLAVTSQSVTGLSLRIK